MIKTKECIDCNTKINIQSTRCRPCADKQISMNLKGKMPKNLESLWAKPKSEKFMSVLRNRLKGSNHHMWKGGISKTPEYIRLTSKTRKALSRNAGELSIKTVQLVYEDSIKKYGTLTCYLCELPIEFGKDELEHKTPLIRGGTNEYNNLGVACVKCNHKKHTKTVEEFTNQHKTERHRQWIKKNILKN